MYQTALLGLHRKGHCHPERRETAARQRLVHPNMLMAVPLTTNRVARATPTSFAPSLFLYVPATIYKDNYWH